MTETLTITVGEPYAAMLAELREMDGADPDSDLRELVEDAIHNGYQQSQSED